MKKQQIIIACLVLFIIDAFCSLGAAAQTKAKTISYPQDSIAFVSRPSDYKMAGTLSYPTKKGKHPAIILVWGSGPQTRDQVISKFPMFKIMADYFNQAGYAVLRIDKRGFGKSEGPKDAEAQTTTGELADDVCAALQFLKKQPHIDSTHIGLIGHSEGAWIAEMIALKDSSIRWLVLLGAHILSGEDTQTNQMTSNLLRLGAQKEVVEKVRPQIKRYLDFIEAGYANDSMYYAIGKDFLLAHGMEEKDVNHQLIDQLLDGFKTPWYQYYLSRTPGDLIAQLKIPAYFIYGGADENVTPDTNLPPLLAVLKQSGNQQMTLTVLPGLDHFFEVKKETGWTLSDKLCPAISFWLKSLHP